MRTDGDGHGWMQVEQPTSHQRDETRGSHERDLFHVSDEKIFAQTDVSMGLPVSFIGINKIAHCQLPTHGHEKLASSAN